MAERHVAVALDVVLRLDRAPQVDRHSRQGGWRRRGVSRGIALEEAAAAEFFGEHIEGRVVAAPEQA